MFELRTPSERHFEEWTACHREWGPGAHEDGFGLLPSDNVDDRAGFGRWIARISAADIGCTYRWIMEGDRVLGGIALRHVDNGFGHVGYGVRPSARGRGLATWALGRMLMIARELGIDPVIAVCADDNDASARTVEHNGGVLADVITTDRGVARRYRIAV